MHCHRKSGILGALGGNDNRSAYLGFQLQMEADAGSTLAGRNAAIQFGIREQIALQNMWDDPILSTITNATQFFGLLDTTTIHTEIGNIVAPQGARDVTNRNDRIAIAKNAFNYMYQNLFTGNNTANWAKVNDTLSSRMDSRNLSQRPRILRFQI